MSNDRVRHRTASWSLSYTPRLDTEHISVECKIKMNFYDETQNFFGRV